MSYYQLIIIVAMNICIFEIAAYLCMYLLFPPRTLGKGIVMTAGRLHLLTQAFVNIKAIRDFHHSTLPVEVFYNGPTEITPLIVQHMEAALPLVRFIDIQSIADAPEGIANVRVCT